MTARNITLAACLIVAATLAAIWLTHHYGGRPTLSPHDTSTATAQAATSAVKASIGKVDAKSHRNGAAQTMPHTLPDWNAPLDQAIPILSKLADAGYVDAEIDLSRRLAACTDHAFRQAAESDESDRASIEYDKTDSSIDEAARATRAANVKSRIDQHAEIRRSCGLLPRDVTARWLDPVDRAAQSGNTDAMVEYARLALTEYDSVAAVVADLDTAIERRDKARRYLLGAARLGDTRALRDLAYAYLPKPETPSPFAPDPSLTYAYAYAGTLAGASRGSELDYLMSESAKLLDAHQLASAQTEGQKIYQRCCKGE